MKNVNKLSLSGDLWDGPLNHDWKNHDPSIEDFDCALKALDALERTMVSIHYGDEACLTIAGGSGRYVVYACTGDENFWNLMRPDKEDGVVLLNAGGQEGDFPARQVVDFSQASAAGAFFFKFHQMDPSLYWEKQ